MSYQILLSDFTDNAEKFMLLRNRRLRAVDPNSNGSVECYKGARLEVSKTTVWAKGVTTGIYAK